MSIKTSFASLIVKEISKTISQNQSTFISRILQVFLIESISLITSKKEINKKTKIEHDFSIKTF